MRTAMILRAALTALLATGALAAAAACEMNFALIDASASKRILPGSTVALKAGSSYTLRVEFVEDHRNCPVAPEETLFMLDGSSWRAGSSEQGLILSNSIAWVEESKTKNRADIAFTADKVGSFALGILRDCAKGGYDERIEFAVK